MASIAELVRLNNEGDLGTFLEERFGGKRGHLYPRKDFEFIVGFDSEVQTPLIPSIAEAIKEHYESLGYKVVTQGGSPRHMFEATIYPAAPEDDGWMHLTLSTRYPLAPGDGRKNIRVTTEMCV